MSDHRHLHTNLHKTHSNIHGDTCASLWTLVVGNWPWIALQILNDRSEDKLAVLDRQEEPEIPKLVWNISKIWHGISAINNKPVGTKASGLWLSRSNSRSRNTKHFLDLFGSVFLRASENIGLWTIGESELMHLSLIQRSYWISTSLLLPTSNMTRSLHLPWYHM